MYDVIIFLKKLFDHLEYNWKIIILNTVADVDKKTWLSNTEYYKHARESYYSILESLWLKKEILWLYEWEKQWAKREYEIIKFQK